jgi:hypothetical protein
MALVIDNQACGWQWTFAAYEVQLHDTDWTDGSDGSGLEIHRSSEAGLCALEYTKRLRDRMPVPSGHSGRAKSWGRPWYVATTAIHVGLDLQAIAQATLPSPRAGG